jgi:hypothetical protein
MVEFSFGCDCTGHIILDYLKFVDAVSWQVEVERIAIVEFRLNK